MRAQLLVVSAIVMTLLILGCSSSPDNVVVDPDSEEDSDFAEILAKLPAADRALAEKQQVFPISNQPLGSMGVPVKLDVNGQAVLICCASCEDAVNEKPDDVSARLAKDN